MINYLLNLNVKIIPVFILCILYLLPNIIMKYKFKQHYTPVYTKLPMFNNSKKLQDFYFARFCDPDLETRKAELRRINLTTSKSFFIGSVLTPTIFALLLGWLKIPATIFYQSVVIFLFIRIYQFTKCTFELNQREYIPKKNILIGLYVFYITNYFYSTFKGYSAAIIGISGIIDFVFGFIIQSIISFYGNSIGINKFNPIDHYLEQNVNVLNLDSEQFYDPSLDETALYKDPDYKEDDSFESYTYNNSK